jgi:hypothetical protein
MIFFLGIIILYRFIIDYVFKNLVIINTHSLFRSFFCFFISTLSMGSSIINWNHLITNSLNPTYLSTIINKLMLAYMIIDTMYFIFEKNIRLELLFHHTICIGLYGFFWDKSILSFCSISEILSAFNWIGILYPNYEWSIKLFRLYAIIFIRLGVWICTLGILSKYTYYYWLGIIFILIFICLDCYWIWIIIANYIKYKNFIKQKIISKTNKIFSKTNKKFKKFKKIN